MGTPGADGDRGLRLAIVLVLVVVVAGAAVLFGVAADVRARDEQEEPRPIVLQISVVDAAGGRAEGVYVLELGEPDADALGVPRRVTSQFGTFELTTATELAPRSTYSYCLEQTAPVTRDGAEVGSVPSGACMAGGATNRAVEVRVRA